MNEVRLEPHVATRKHGHCIATVPFPKRILTGNYLIHMYILKLCV